MEMVGELINEVLRNIGNQSCYRSVEEKVKRLCEGFPLYTESQSKE